MLPFPLSIILFLSWHQSVVYLLLFLLFPFSSQFMTSKTTQNPILLIKSILKKNKKKRTKDLSLQLNFVLVNNEQIKTNRLFIPRKSSKRKNQRIVYLLLILSNNLSGYIYFWSFTWIFFVFQFQYDFIGNSKSNTIPKLEFVSWDEFRLSFISYMLPSVWINYNTQPRITASFKLLLQCNHHSATLRTYAHATQTNYCQSFEKQLWNHITIKASSSFPAQNYP